MDRKEYLLRQVLKLFKQQKESRYVLNIEEEDKDEYRKMVTDKIPASDWGIVEDNGKTYYIMYVL